MPLEYVEGPVAQLHVDDGGAGGLPVVFVHALRSALCPSPGLLELLRATARGDLNFINRHWREPSYDIWEEELGQHYYTLLLHHAALMDGAFWTEQTGVHAAEFAPARAWLQSVGPPDPVQKPVLTIIQGGRRGS